MGVGALRSGVVNRCIFPTMSGGDAYEGAWYSLTGNCKYEKEGGKGGFAIMRCGRPGSFARD
jgi:hypothetical protein